MGVCRFSNMQGYGDQNKKCYRLRSGDTTNELVKVRFRDLQQKKVSAALFGGGGGVLTFCFH